MTKLALEGAGMRAVAAMGAAGGALVGGVIGRALKVDAWLPCEVPAAAVAFVPLRGGAALSIRMAWGNGPGHGI